MNPVELSHFISLCYASNEPLFITGAPGCGKTHIPQHVAKCLKVAFKVLRAPNMDVVDIRGLPDLHNRKYTHWLRPDTLPVDEPEDPNYQEKGIMAVDELPSAVQAMQASFYELYEVRPDGTRWVAGHRIPPGWLPIAMGNRLKDKAVVHKMPTPLISRLAIVELEQDNNGFVEFMCSGEAEPVPSYRAAQEKLFHPMIIAYIKQFPEHQNNFDPEKIKDNEPYACERSWERFSRFLNVFLENNLPLQADQASKGQPFLSQEYITAFLGKGVANGFSSWIELYKEVPTREEILLNPSSAPVPKKPSFKYAVAAMLGRCISPTNIDQVMTYCARLPKAFEVLTLMTGVRLDTERINQGGPGQSFQNTKSFVRWANKNQGVVL